MKRKFIFLINPISGNGKKDFITQEIKDFCASEKLSYEILPTNASGNYDFLIEKIRSERISDIVLAGGDGTVNQVVGSIVKADLIVNVGIIPCGSGNGLAFTAGIPKKTKKALELILHGEAKYIDAFELNGRFSCMLSGLGFDAKVAHVFARKAYRGLLSYTQQSLLHFFKAQPYQFEVKLGDHSFFTEAFFISIANSNQFGNHIKIAPHASLSDGLLDIVIVQKMNKAKLPFAILKQIRGNNRLQNLVDEVSKNNILYFQSPTITIHNLKFAPLHIDGEPVESEDVIQVNILKRSFRLFIP
ncbi:MAG: YegS/Rv2252/BmrU family lipid kinase [Bacteroidetes bacterium]|nr:YegS/Rv2252/BmrU family lipid kinase [Bacteroidota bacterium]